MLILFNSASLRKSHTLQYQELVRIVLCKHQYRMTDKTAKRLWQQSPPAPQGALPLGDYHSYPERSEARLEVLKLYVQGWNKLSISRVLPVSRPTVDRWIRRFEDEQLAGLVDRPRGLQTASEHCLPQCGIKPIVSDSCKYLHINT
jgi:hypothetical protein